MTELAERTLLTTVKISQWSARKKDRKVTAEVHETYHARADAGSYNKALVSKSALEEIAGIASAARQTFYELTLPWLDDGARIITVHAYDQYESRMMVHSEAFAWAVEKFLDNYPAYIEAAEERLNGMFDKRDYPPTHEMRRRFKLDFYSLPIPSGQDFRADLSDEQQTRLRAEIEQRTSEAITDAMRSAWQRVAEAVGHMADKLSKYEAPTNEKKAVGIFRDSLVENVSELVDLLPNLNVTGDPKLDEMAKRLKTLCANDAQTLRDSDITRNETAKAAQAILAEVSDYIA